MLCLAAYGRRTATASQDARDQFNGMAHLEVAVFLRKRTARESVALSEDVLLEVAHVRLDMQEGLEARRQALLHCLAQLKEQSRELLERCYAGKDTIRQIAEELRIR